MRKPQAHDYGLIERPHEVEQFSPGNWRCRHCFRGYDTVAEAIQHVVENQQDVRALR